MQSLLLLLVLAMSCCPGWRAAGNVSATFAYMSACSLSGPWGEWPDPQWEDVFRNSSTFETDTPRLRWRPDPEAGASPIHHIRTIPMVDIRDCPIAFEIQPPTGFVGTRQVLMGIGREGEPGPIARWTLSGGVLKAYVRWNDGDIEEELTLTYDATEHRYWRIRWDAGDVVFDTLAACGIWEERLRVPTGGAAAPGGPCPEVWEDWCTFPGSRWAHYQNYPTPASEPSGTVTDNDCSGPPGDGSLAVGFTNPITEQRTVRWATVPTEEINIRENSASVRFIPLLGDNVRSIMGLFSPSSSAYYVETYFSLVGTTLNAYTYWDDGVSEWGYVDDDIFLGDGILRVRWGHRVSTGELVMLASGNDGATWVEINAVEIPAAALESLVVDLQVIANTDGASPGNVSRNHTWGEIVLDPCWDGAGAGCPDVTWTSAELANNWELVPGSEMGHSVVGDQLRIATVVEGSQFARLVKIEPFDLVGCGLAVEVDPMIAVGSAFQGPVTVMRFGLQNENGFFLEFELRDDKNTFQNPSAPEARLQVLLYAGNISFEGDFDVSSEYPDKWYFAVTEVDDVVTVLAGNDLNDLTVLHSEAMGEWGDSTGLEAYFDNFVAFVDSDLEALYRGPFPYGDGLGEPTPGENPLARLYLSMGFAEGLVNGPSGPGGYFGPMNPTNWRSVGSLRATFGNVPAPARSWRGSIAATVGKVGCV